MGTRRFISSITVAALALSACAPDMASRLETDDALAPPGVATRGTSIDPMVVADRLMEAGEYELAINSYGRAAADTGMTPEIEHAIASANIRLGRLGQANKGLERLLALDPNNPRYLNDHAVVLMEQGETGQAMRIFQKAFALDSGNSPEIRENLRVALAKMENPSYSEPHKDAFNLVSHGNGIFTLSQQDP